MDNFIDVEKLIESRNKNLLKWLPKFFIRWVEKIIHQDDINDIMLRYKGVETLDFCAGIVEEFNLNLNIKGIENIPHQPQSCIFVGNHPLGGLDAIAVIHSFREVRPDLYFIVNDFLMYFEPLKDRFIGVNKLGKSAKESLKKVEAQFASENATFVFPAGLVSRRTKGKVEDVVWQKTFVSKSKKYNKQVVPVFLDGKLTNRFYRLANFRKLLGIKFNIEMFFLIDELFKQKNTNIDIVIGEPIMPETFTKEKPDKEWATWVKEKVYNLNKA